MSDGPATPVTAAGNLRHIRPGSIHTGGRTTGSREIAHVTTGMTTSTTTGAKGA